MSTFNEWGGNDPNMDENLGDIVYDEIEQEAKELAKDGADKAGDAAVHALDKATDHIAPVKTVKDKIKEKLSYNPITRAKAAFHALKDKAKNAVKNLARNGIKAVGRFALEAVKAIGRLIAVNPVVAVIIIIILLLFISVMDDTDNDNTNNLQDDSILLENPAYVNLDGMSDDDVVVILMGDCVDQQYDSMDEMIQMTLEKEEQAKDIYSIFHDYGFYNTTIAGILANIDVESGLDSSAIEGIYNEYGILGTKKAAALTSISAYTERTLFPLYKNSGVSINQDGYKTINAEGKTVYYCGLGLVQWTGENAKTLLTAAENLDIEWYNKDFQLGYMISDCMYRPGFFEEWVDNQEPDFSFDEDDYDRNNYATQEEYEDAVEEGREAALEAALESAKKSALHFAHGYEGNTATDEKRQNAAMIWYQTIAEWGTEDNEDFDADDYDEYVDSISGLASDLAAIIEFIDIEEAQYRCLAGNVFDNSSLASAGLSIAWPRREQSFNNGTNLYQTVLKTIWPKNYIFKACDRTVACAVVWSGTDIDFPLGSTATQLRYMETSSKWERVGSASSLSMDDLQPGDVFCLNGHTFMYVGKDTVQAAYANEADPSSDSISGSLNKRSAGCDSSTTSIMNRGGQDWEGRGVYNVYRCVNPDNSDKWSSIGAGMTN